MKEQPPKMFPDLSLTATNGASQSRILMILIRLFSLYLPFIFNMALDLKALKNNDCGKKGFLNNAVGHAFQLVVLHHGWYPRDSQSSDNNHKTMTTDFFVQNDVVGHDL